MTRPAYTIDDLQWFAALAEDRREADAKKILEARRRASFGKGR